MPVRRASWEGFSVEIVEDHEYDHLHGLLATLEIILTMGFQLCKFYEKF